MTRLVSPDGRAHMSLSPGWGPLADPAPGTAVALEPDGVGIFTSGAIDSLFENGPDVRAAYEAGRDALVDTGEAIGDAAGAVGDAIGGLFD